MRKAFIDTLTQLAETDKNIWLLTADMGFGLVEPFAEKFPKQFVNVGVAEQNMIGVATGLALEGKKVFCYSIANFPTIRCLEQIRNDICYHNLPVCIVSGGAGLWYGALGMSHHAVEDIAIMRVLPNMAVVSPCDAKETEQAVTEIVKRGQPSYIRMSRPSDSVLPMRKYRFGTAKVIAGTPAATDVAIVATGGRMVAYALLAGVQLRGRKVQVRVLNVHTIKPLDRRAILDAALTTTLVVTIEEHSIIGGLGSAVAERLSGVGHALLKIMGVDDCYPTTAMSYEELLVANHLTVDDIVKEVLDAL